MPRHVGKVQRDQGDEQVGDKMMRDDRHLTDRAAGGAEQACGKEPKSFHG